MILAVESSCDETGVALYDGKNRRIAHKLYSQVRLHQEFGGVVPELASRDHVRKLLPLCQELLREQGVQLNQVSAIAYTAGPGLMGALLVAATWACGLAASLEVPLVPVNHLEGHLMAAFLEERPPSYPFLGLLVSGGNTLLVEVAEFGSYRVLGATLDDAIGEAFDKVAKMMGLGYPGGVLLSRLADERRGQRCVTGVQRGAGEGCAEDVCVCSDGVRNGAALPVQGLPIPMQHRPGYDFSFSGLKTEAGALIRRLQASGEWEVPGVPGEVAYLFQEAATQSVALRVKKALLETGHKRLVVAGGVSANQRLRAKLAELARELSAEVFLARPEFCTDNAAMIAVAGWERWVRGEVVNAERILVNPRWELGSGLAGLERHAGKHKH